MAKRKPREVRVVTCPLCGQPMVLRKSEHGQFYGCTEYPGCRGTRPLKAGADFAKDRKKRSYAEQDVAWYNKQENQLDL